MLQVGAGARARRHARSCARSCAHACAHTRNVHIYTQAHVQARSLTRACSLNDVHVHSAGALCRCTLSQTPTRGCSPAAAVSDHVPFQRPVTSRHHASRPAIMRAFASPSRPRHVPSRPCKVLVTSRRRHIPAPASFRSRPLAHPSTSFKSRPRPHPAPCPLATASIRVLRHVTPVPVTILSHPFRSITSHHVRAEDT